MMGASVLLGCAESPHGVLQSNPADPVHGPCEGEDQQPRLREASVQSHSLPHGAAWRRVALGGVVTRRQIWM